MANSKTLKAQTSHTLQQSDVRRAAAAYELIVSANIMLEALPIPVLEALRDYAEERIKGRKDEPAVLCERHYMEHLNELIRGAHVREMRLVQAITGGVVPPAE